jgi:pterin-4a-carbinolamine dehydratase
MKKLLLNKNRFFLLLLLLNFAAFVALAQPSGEPDPQPVEIPEFRPPEYPAYENDLIFGVFNPNGEGSTEIYRSTNETEGFVLVASISASEETFLDQNLRSNTMYFYKMRAELNEVYSEYSNTLSLTTGSKLYPPELSAEAINGSSIKVTLQDVSYNDVSYELWRELGPDAELIETISAPDSGEVFVITDTGLEPNTKYNYRVDVRAQGLGNVFYPGMVRTSATTTNQEELETPYLDLSLLYETTIELTAESRTEGAQIEFYRAMNEPENWERVSLEKENSTYVDRYLKPRTTYYYRIRTEKDGVYSEYTPYVEATTYSIFYYPDLETELTEDNKVKVTLTDNSYADIAYTLNRLDDSGISQPIELPDSGQTYTFIDESVLLNNTYVYSLDVIIDDEGRPQYHDFVRDTIYVPGPGSLSPPLLSFTEPPTTFDCGNEISMNYFNQHDGAITEIYRSRSADGAFERVFAGTEKTDTYVDRGLTSQKSYYYKARAVKGDSVSEYSNTIAKRSGYAFHEPEFTITLQANQTVEVKVHDRSYLDYSYELYGWNAEDGVQSINTTFQLPDSGQTFMIIDTLVVPGKTYTHHVNTTLDCDGYPGTGEEYVSNPVTIPEAEEKPMVYSFTLVDPNTDMDIAEMYDSMEFAAADRLNIRINTNAMTKSVAFYMNGKRYWGENQEPYALFGDRFGDYNRGRLTPGVYTLTAVPYSENLQRGMEGQAMTITFTVTDEDGSTNARSFIEVNVFPNPVVEKATIEVAGEPNTAVSMEIIDQQGTSLNKVNEPLDNQGWLVKEWAPQNLKRGTYYITIKMNDETYTKRITVK